VRGACTRARRREDCGDQIHVDAQRRGLRHDVSDLTLEAIEESCVGAKKIIFLLLVCAGSAGALGCMTVSFGITTLGGLLCYPGR